MAKEVVSGKHKTNTGNWDGMHKFGSGDSTWANLHGFAQFGTKGGGSGKVAKALHEFYKKYNLNPCITSVKLTVDPVKFTVDYEFTIEESPDGNAYVGVSSWGGATSGYPKKLKPSPHAYTNYKLEYNGVKNNHKNTIIKDVIDFYFPGGFRQIFFQFTWPDKYPNLPKSPDLREGTVGVKIGPSGSPDNLPEYNGVLVQTVVYNDSQTTGLSASNTSTTGSSVSNTEDATRVINDKLINGKIIITKKSGPGELTGENEIDLADANNTGVSNATFSDLQFTEAGDYVLSITCTSDLVEPYELKVKVSKEDEVIPQEESKGEQKEEKPIDGSRPIIAQIDKPSIVVTPIEMDQDIAKGAGSQKEITTGLGFNPIISYNGLIIEERYIRSMRLYHNGIIPMIDVIFEDSKDVLKNLSAPSDNVNIDLFLNSNSENLKSIHMVFKVKSFNQGTQVPNRVYSISGTANIPGLYVQNNKSYKGTSFEVLRKICKELGIGFNSNIKNTDDYMKWVNTNKKPYEFIEDIIPMSYISDTNYTAGYIDYYYCFNYVDIQKEIDRDTSKDLGLNTHPMTPPDESTRLMSLRLTNEDSQTQTSNFIESYTTTNDSTKKSLSNGYTTITKSYDRTTKTFQVFTIDPITSDGSETIILRDAPGTDKYLLDNIRHKFTGKTDTDNVHKNYNYAKTHNRENLNTLNKIVVNAVLSNANWNLYKFQKIGIDLIEKTITPTNTNSIKDYRYSGFYTIADIEYIWNGKRMSQRLRLVRSELGKTPEEIQNDPPVQKKEEVKEYNENPIGLTPSTPPNSVYSLGQVYLGKGNNDKIYEVTVNNILENGIEVIASLKESLVNIQPDPKVIYPTSGSQSVQKDSEIPVSIETVVNKVDDSNIPINTQSKFNVEKNNIFTLVDIKITKPFEITLIENGEVYINDIFQDDDLDDIYKESLYEGSEEIVPNTDLAVAYDKAMADAAEAASNEEENTKVGGEIGEDSISFDYSLKEFIPRSGATWGDFKHVYDTTYKMYIDHKKMPKPTYTKAKLIKGKLAVEGGVTGATTDSAYEGGAGLCPTPYTGGTGANATWNGKKIHTNKGVTYKTWKSYMGSGKDKAFHVMSLKDWTTIFDKGYWNDNQKTKYESVNCLLVAFAWGGSKSITIRKAEALLGGRKIGSVSEEEACAALFSARAQLFINISQPNVQNNVYRKGWVKTAVGTQIKMCYYS